MSDQDELVTNQVQQVEPSHWQAFTYMSGSPPVNSSDQTEQSSSRDIQNSEVSPQNFPLASAKVGDRIRITSLNCGEANNRLVGMGLIPGAILEVMSCTPSGSVIVALQDQRLGLGAEMARLIQVVCAEKQFGASSSRTIARMVTMQTYSEASSDVSTVKLRNVSIGAIVRVMGYESTARDYKRKLLAMGLTPGTQVRVTRHAPMGDPTEIEVRGFHLSLRKAEADALIVEPISGS